MNFRTYKEKFVWPMTKTATTKKPLVPYYPNAPRNRLPVRFDNEPEPGVRYCKTKNASSFV